MEFHSLISGKAFVFLFCIPLLFQTAFAEKSFDGEDDEVIKEIYIDDTDNNELYVEDVTQEESGKTIDILIDAEKTDYKVPALLHTGKVYVPLRALMEDIGAEVVYDEKEQNVRVSYGDSVLLINLRDGNCFANSVAVGDHSAALIYSGNIMVATGLLEQSFDISVQYDESKSIVFLGTDKKIDRGLQEYCNLLRDMWVWQVNLYDPVTGGFYPTRSLAATPGEKPTIQATAQALSVFTYLNCIDQLPESIKDNIVSYIKGCQKPESGYFVDNEKTASSFREKGRALNFAVDVLNKFNEKPDYALPAERGNAEIDIAESTLPEYLESPEIFKQWMQSLPWEGSPWHCGDVICAATMLLDGMDEARVKEYYDVVFDFCRDYQNPSDGMWGGNDTPFRVISGAFKLACIYRTASEPIPNAMKVYQTTIDAMRYDEGIDACFVRNPIDLFSALCDSSTAVKEQIKKDLPEIIRISLQNTKKLEMEGGGCIKSLFYGADPTGLAEGDLNGGAAMRITSGYLHTLAGRKKDYCEELVPKLIQIMETKKSAAQYLDENLENKQWTKDNHFYTLYQNDFETDRGITDGRYSLSKTNEENNAALQLCDTSVEDKAYAVLDGFETGVARSVTIEMKLKMQPAADNRGPFYITIGKEPLIKLLVFRKNNKYYFGRRNLVSGNVKDTELCPFERDKLYSVTVQIIPKNTVENDICIYVDGKKVDTTQAFYNAENPEYLSVVDSLTFETTAKTCGNFFVDDVLISQTKQ